MTNSVNIGRLSFSRDSVEKSRHGKVYRGLFDEFVDVSIVRVDKSEIFVDKKLLHTTDMHPNVVRFYGTEEDADGEFLYVSFEHCAGTLKQLISSNYKGPAVGISTTEMLWQITSAIEYLHEKSICHCDLKPSNILVSCSDGSLQPRMKLSNFGFSRVSKTALPLWKLAGTKGWMAPEIYDLETFTPLMDIFSLGLLYVFVLSRGLHAFGVEKEDRIVNIKKRQPMTLTIQQLKNVVRAAEVFKLICKMLSFDPEQRPIATAVLNDAFFYHPNYETSTAVETTVPVETKPKEEPIVKSETMESRITIPPLMRIGLSNDSKDLLYKTEKEEEIHQQLPTPPPTASPRVSTPIPETASETIADCASSTSSSSTCPLDSPRSRSPFLNLTIDLDVPSSEERSFTTPTPLPQPQPSTSADLPDELAYQSAGGDDSHGKMIEWTVPKKIRFSSSKEVRKRERAVQSPIPSPPSPPRNRSSSTPDRVSSRSSHRYKPYRPRNTDRSSDRTSNDGRYLEKEKQISYLCKEEILDDSKLEYLHQLIVDPTVKINHRIDSSPPFLLLCQFNRSESLYSTLKVFLQRQDLDISCTSPSGYNALMFLCRFYLCERLLDCVQLLIDRGINLEAREKGHKTAIQLLCQYYSGKNLMDVILRFLYNSKNFGDAFLCTRILWERKFKMESKMLHKCCVLLRDGQNPKEVELLELCSRADLNSAAVQRFRALVCDKELNVNCIEEASGHSPLLVIILNNQSDRDYEHIEFLLQSNRVNVTLKGKDGWAVLGLLSNFHSWKNLVSIFTLLFLYGANDFDDSVQILRKRNMYHEAENVGRIIDYLRSGHSRKEAVLLELCSRSHLDELALQNFRQLVSDEDVNLNCVEYKTGRTPILILCHNNQNDDLCEYIECLLRSKRADIHAKGGDGWNCLPIVCLRHGGKNLVEIVELLISRGIDVNNTSGYGWHAMFALGSNVIRENDPRLFEVIKVLVDAGLYVNAVAKNGLNALVTLTETYRRHRDFALIVQYLIDKGLNVNVRNISGKNALIVLCERLAKDPNLIQIVQLLIHHGIDTRVKDIKNYSAVDILRALSFPESSDVVQLLVSKM